MKPTAIVTGASRGIGRAVATELAKTHQVIATYRGRQDAAESLRAGTGCEIFQCDIGSRTDREALIAFARERFQKLLAGATGSSTRIVHAVLLDTPLSIDRGEVTDKGSINQRAVLEHRSQLIDVLYSQTPPAHVITLS